MAGPRVAVIGTGGTISSVGRHGLDLVAYLENNKIYEVDELLNAFPETLDQGTQDATRYAERRTRNTRNTDEGAH